MMPADTAGQPPDPGPARSLDELVECLRALKLWAGDPSYDTITRRVNARWQAGGRPADELARRGTVVDCFKTGRRRINADLVVTVVQTLHDEAGYVAHWRQALRVSLAESTAAGQVRVADRLPDDFAAFSGRDAELDRLRRLAPAGGGAVVCVLTGMAGVGKTQLAVHAGHLLAAEGRFDTILFVDLRGFHPDPGQPPAEPAAVLDGFLRLLGVSALEIPYELTARAARYRERLAGRRALVLLDNAADEAQVRPLLPDGPGTLTLITSRRGLAALSQPAAENSSGTSTERAVRLGVDVFTAEEAEHLLIRAVPGVAVGPDPSAYHRVAVRCGHLPLALGVVAGQMAAQPEWTVTDHADRLDERHRHHRLDTGVELALHLSYQHLPEQRRTLLRRLAAHPGQDLDEHAAAALLDASLATTRDQLRHLVAEHLVQQPVSGRFLLHDLVRAYAGERARDQDRPAERRAALGRLFDLYLYGAAAAMDALYPAERHRRPSLPEPAGPALDGLDLSDPKTALRWLDAERATLVAVCLYAARNGWPEHAVRLAAILYSYLDNGGHPADAIAVHTEARDAARLTGDGIAEAGALTNLGVVYWQLGRHPAAVESLEQALALCRRLGDGSGAARALGNLGVVHTTTGRHEAAADYHRQALDRFVELGDRVGEANTLTNLGDVYVRLGRLAPAVEHHRRALDLFRDLEHRGGEATALTNLGDVHVELGRHADAVTYHEQALTLFRDLGERYGQTCALNGLGEALAGLGRPDEAIAGHTAALALATEIDEPEEQVRAREGLARLRPAGTHDED
jgi:tetratricopeptide (TPR) repeat protein